MLNTRFYSNTSITLSEVNLNGSLAFNEGDYGLVLSVGDGIIYASGLSDIEVGALVNIE
jgi:hypothetical protein